MAPAPTAFSPTVCGLCVVTVMLLPETWPGSPLSTTPPLTMPPVLTRLVLPRIDLPSRPPTSLVSGLATVPMALRATR